MVAAVVAFVPAGSAVSQLDVTYVRVWAISASFTTSVHPMVVVEFTDLDLRVSYRAGLARFGRCDPNFVLCLTFDQQSPRVLFPVDGRLIWGEVQVRSSTGVGVLAVATAGASGTLAASCF